MADKVYTGSHQKVEVPYHGQFPPSMNYSNMIEEKNLKKTFIIATLASTLIGTFTAATTLHDKIQEKREKAKQKETDGKQNNQLKKLKEQVASFEKAAIETKEKFEANLDEKPSDDKDKRGRSRSRSRSRSSSRSRSRRRRRRRELLEDEAFFADSVRRSKAMIQQTYAEGLNRVGPAYAVGDLTTENRLQAQVIKLQQTVIGVLQQAVNDGRSLTQKDFDQLIAAQHEARNGSISALQEQEDRMLAGRDPDLKRITNGLEPREKASSQPDVQQLAIEPAYDVRRPSSLRSQAKPWLPAREALFGVDGKFAQPRELSVFVAPKEPMPVNAKRASVAVQQLANTDPLPSEKMMKSNGVPAATEAGRQRATSVATQAPKATTEKRAASVAAQASKSSPPNKTVVGGPTNASTKTVVGKAASVSPKASSKNALVLADEPKRERAASQAAAPPTLSAKASPPTRKPAQKPIATPEEEIFCYYSEDLQRSSLPLNSAFRPSGNHRCPTCHVKIPVDTRDVWVLSTHFPGKENRQKVREYRMDARFVVKCHNADGEFACVLCDRYRDMDCICRSVDALVKHLGTAHSPDEFEHDPDLVRMEKGSRLDVRGRELALGVR
ncbi:unnamed protein product [Zymoseptoria tritici ST99CH_1A5]|uniref:C2H2-type domain-containing protein n=2 Tax=Zymoseptoria tritici TaxID=1047171 RepID=A0A1X7RUY6_ZYMT9|nr:unnamed protein product [Zymoseptoria tritici ST99CH_3D7]SMR54820.1 unnamed protein product [Zymoseptoria tritici ST99CH_3D1]SMY24897.1 unnamed protein product [Zymoseptoria tritici ST99CH_1A5]